MVYILTGHLHQTCNRAGIGLVPKVRDHSTKMTKGKFPGNKKLVLVEQ